MKRLYQLDQWRDHSRARSRQQAKRMKAWKRRKKHRNRLRYSFQGVDPVRNRFDQNFVTVRAPDVFSFIENTAGVLACMAAMHQAFKGGKGVFLDLENITSISCDAIALLVSNISDPKFTRGHPCTGSEPNNDKLASILKQSGFYAHVRSLGGGRSWDHDNIFRRQGKKVELKYIEKMVTFSTSRVYGIKTKVGGVYRALIECMANTLDHASALGKQHERWLTSVYYDNDRNTACFTFLDNGVGIFKSRKLVSYIDQISRIIGVYPNARILREILEGKLASSTGLPYRGKGLPSIFRASNRKQISRLIIITNDVYADVATGSYRSLSPAFKGTFLYWELTRN